MSRTSPLIAPAELATRLQSGDMAVVDCRFSLADTDGGRRAYLEAHIPGAVYANLDRDLSGPLAEDGTGGRHPLPTPPKFCETLGRLGIERSMDVAVYDADTGMFAARLWWMLRWLGHAGQVKVVEGGFAAWQAAGFPVQSSSVSVEPQNYVGSPDESMTITLDEVQHATGDSRYALLDARGSERFRGEVEPLDRSPGHIPGATSRPFRDNLNEKGQFRSPDELAASFGSMSKVDADKRIFYCGSGVSACHNLLALDRAGLGSARLYVGSYSEWSSDPARPIETSEGEN